MLLPIDLQNAINQAQDALLKNPLSNLAAFYRQIIYRAIGNFEQPSSLEVHTRLSVITARFVSFKWFEAWPEDTLPNQLLDTAEGMINKKINKEKASKECLDAWNALCVHLEETEYETAFSAGLAAYKALSVSCGINPWEDLIINDSNYDDFDPETIDTALCAANAYSGPIWSSDFNALKRLEFWKWWLNEAIPQAWELASDSVPQ